MPAVGRAQLKEYLRDHGVSFDVVEHARSESAAAEARAVNRAARSVRSVPDLRSRFRGSLSRVV